MAEKSSIRITGDVVTRPRKPWTPTVQPVPFAAGPVVCHGDPQPADSAWRDA